jgi:hypothetical protein
VIFKGKSILEKETNGIAVSTSESGWIDQEIKNQWFTSSSTSPQSFLRNPKKRVLTSPEMLQHLNDKKRKKLLKQKEELQKRN